MKKICVIGLGYIGIPTAVVAAESGFDVAGFDIDKNKVERLNHKEAVISEPELAPRLAAVIEEKSFVAYSEIQEADCFIICVPTPLNNKKHAELSYVYSAAAEIAKVIKKGDLVLLESTVPVGTSNNVANYLEQQTGLKAGKDFFFAFCPERVLPGKIFYELVYNSRIVGGINKKSSELAEQFYGRFVKGEACYDVDASSAEMVKLVENSYRDVNIAFAHQVAGMSESIGLDPYKIIELANKHPRVNVLNPTCGVGGHCISIDPWFLAETFPNDTQLLVSARQINNARPYNVLEKIQSKIKEFKKDNPSKSCKLAVLGLTYKADVDDLRESPALFIAEQLKMYKDITLMAVEPNVEQSILQKYFDSSEIYSCEDAINSADIIVVLVGHSVFKNYSNLVEEKTVLDYCKLFKKSEKDSLFCSWQLKEKNETSLS